MRAEVGDWLVIKGRTVEQADHRGLITEVHSADGSPPYVVKWLDSGHVATVIPGPDAIIVTAAEQPKGATSRSDRSPPRCRPRSATPPRTSRCDAAPLTANRHSRLCLSREPSQGRRIIRRNGCMISTEQFRWVKSM
jgi:Domain of unknown function (DUF1918)